jgi:endoglucanase
VKNSIIREVLFGKAVVTWYSTHLMKGSKMRLFILTSSILIALVSHSAANIIELHKGIGTDIWVSWPAEEELKQDPTLIDTFPEWRKTIGPQQISNLRKAGFDFVRLTIDPIAYIWKQSPEKTEKLNANVVAAVTMFREQNLNVLVDFHAIPTGGYRKYGMETYVASPENFAQFVGQSASLAKALSALDPAHVAFEPINEPVIDCADENGSKTHLWPAMALQLHDAARKAAPVLTLVMQGSCWGGSDGLSDLQPAAFKDENVIWDFHSYDPFIFTHQGAEWVEGMERYVSGLHFPPQPKQQKKIIAQTLGRINKAKLSIEKKTEMIAQTKYNMAHYFEPGVALKLHGASFEQVAAWAAKHKVTAEHILLGEFGANRTEETAKPLFEDRLTFLKLSREQAEKRGYSWSMWDWSGSMSPTNNDQDRVVLPSYIKALGLTPQK